MGSQYKSLSDSDIDFIQKQKLFFIASSSGHEVNLSPRGYDSLHIIDKQSLYMIDYLGSGNRTARDISEEGEVTLMFTAFEGNPRILRCFCKGELIHRSESTFVQAGSLFDEDLTAIRQIFKFNIYAVESSCGMGVPLMKYQEDRQEVRDYALKMAKSGEFEQYVKEHTTPPDIKALRDN